MTVMTSITPSSPSASLAAGAPLAESPLAWILRRAFRSLGGDPTALSQLEPDEALAVHRAALELVEEHERLWPRRAHGRAA